MAQTVRNLPAMRETWFDPLVGKIPWRRAWQPTPVFLPGESPWTEEPGGLQSMGSQRVRHRWATKSSFHRECLNFFLLFERPQFCWIYNSELSFFFFLPLPSWYITSLTSVSNVSDEKATDNPCIWWVTILFLLSRFSFSLL